MQNTKKRDMASAGIEEGSSKKRINTPALKGFNSLPYEIFIKIFCKINCNELYELKRVCTKWWKIITEMVNIKRLKLSKETRYSAVGVFERWDNSLNFPLDIRMHISIYTERPTFYKMLFAITPYRSYLENQLVYVMQIMKHSLKICIMLLKVAPDGKKTRTSIFGSVS